MSVGSTSGLAVDYSERHTCCEPGSSGQVCDSVWAHFCNEKRWRLTDSSYTAWPSDSNGPINNDPWYHYDHTSDTEHYIRTCSTSGC